MIKEGISLRIVSHWLGDTGGTILSYYSHLIAKSTSGGSGIDSIPAPAPELESDPDDEEDKKSEDEDEGP